MFGKLRGICFGLVAVAGTLVASGLAQAQVVLPATGVDMEGLITTTGTDYGAILAVVMGLAFAFLIIALAWRAGKRYVA